MNWLALLTKYRGYWQKKSIAEEAKNFLQTNYLVDISGFDVIRGYRADDSYFSFVQDFIMGTISLQKLSQAMKLGRLNDQIVLKSKKAFEHLSFVSYEAADVMDQKTGHVLYHKGLSENIKICVPNDGLLKAVEQIWECKCNLLTIPLKDEAGFYNKNKSDAYDNKRITRFIVPGSYSYRKGYDLLMVAISLLPSEMMQKSEFVFCGFTLDSDKEYFDKIKKIADVFPNVIIEGMLIREELYSRYASADCVVIPTRMDLGPLTARETVARVLLY